MRRLVSIRVYQCSASQLNTVYKGKKREGFFRELIPTLLPCPTKISHFIDWVCALSKVKP